MNTKRNTERVAATHPAHPRHYKNIMKLSKILPSAVLCIAGIAGIATVTAPVWVFAQQPAQAPSNAPAPPPPEMENLNEVEAPTVIIKTPQEERQKTITETKQQGRVTEVKVDGPTSTYYLRPKTIGTSVTGAADSGPQTNPTWNVKSFDWGGKKKKANDAGPVDNDPVNK